MQGARESVEKSRPGSCLGLAVKGDINDIIMLLNP